MSQVRTNLRLVPRQRRPHHVDAVDQEGAEEQVVAFVDAELNRQFPGRELWDAHVEDEWSLAETLRHLVLATDTWLRGAIMRIEQPFHELGQIFTGAERMGFDMSVFRTDPPTHEEVLAVRAERQQLVSDFLARTCATSGATWLA